MSLGASFAAAALEIDDWTMLDQGLLIVPCAWPPMQMQFYCLSVGADLAEQCCLYHALVQFMPGSDLWQWKEEGKRGGILAAHSQFAI